jgi:hypothetical protein
MAYKVGHYTNGAVMKEIFEARDIQKIFGIPKHRYEYIATKIGIIPDVEFVEGRGKSHRYSFKNALEFGIAQILGSMGLGPRSIWSVLTYLSESLHSEVLEELLNPEGIIKLKLLIAFKDGKLGISLHLAQRKFSPSEWWMERIMKAQFGPDPIEEATEDADAHLILHLDSIKEKIRRYAEA